MADCKYHTSGCIPTAVYVIGEAIDAPSVKVGYATNPVRRLAQLRRSTRRDLVIHRRFVTKCEFQAMDLEQAVHSALAERWTGRGEWFACSPEIAFAAIENSAARLKIKEVADG